MASRVQSVNLLRSCSVPWSMDFQHRVGSKTGGGGVASSSESNRDRKERLRKLALETIDIQKVSSRDSAVEWNLHDSTNLFILAGSLLYEKPLGAVWVQAVSDITQHWGAHTHTQEYLNKLVILSSSKLSWMTNLLYKGIVCRVAVFAFRIVLV